MSITIDPKLLEILVCPLTKGLLQYDAKAQELISQQAKLAYPIRDGIPIMLIDEAREIEVDMVDQINSTPGRVVKTSDVRSGHKNGVHVYRNSKQDGDAHELSDPEDGNNDEKEKSADVFDRSEQRLQGGSLTSFVRQCRNNIR